MANNLTTPPANTLAFPQQPTAKEWFLKSRDTSWAEPYGGVTPYYPQQRYLDQNLAPNLDITNMQLETLAQANQIARKNKLMSPKLLDAMLPTLLVEGASGTRGWGYPDTPAFQALRDKAGLTDNKRSPTLTTDAESNFVAPTEYDRQLRAAQMMHAMMAAKEKVYGTDLAIERWNGEGKGYRGADAKNHARKVEELTRLLDDPKNAPLMAKWRALNARYAGAGPQEVREAPPVWNWEDKLPGIIGVPIAAARAALPSTNILRDIQRGIRNWTAPK